MGTGGRRGQPRAGRGRLSAEAARLVVGHRGGDGRPAEEARRRAGLAELVSPRPHLSLRPGAVPTEADRPRAERGEGEDAGRAGGLRLQGLPARPGLQGS